MTCKIDYGTCHQVDVPAITPMGGLVVFAGWSSAGYGNLLVIENDSWQVYLAHNNAFLVGVGAIVQAGQVVALSGSTGNSTGPHVHFEVRQCLEDGEGSVTCLPQRLPGRSCRRCACWPGWTKPTPRRWPPRPG